MATLGLKTRYSSASTRHDGKRTRLLRATVHETTPGEDCVRAVVSFPVHHSEVYTGMVSTAQLDDQMITHSVDLKFRWKNSLCDGN